MGRVTAPEYAGAEECARLRIAILEDEEVERRRFVETLLRLAGEKPVDIKTFPRSDAIASCGDTFDLAFLDILMEGPGGMEAAKALHEKSPSTMLVFVTNTPDYVFAGYEVEAYRYLIKPCKDAEIQAVLAKAFGRLEERGLLVHSGATLHRIDFSSILYVEAQGRNSVIRLTDGREIRALEGISELEKRLPADRLMRCQRSFIVNLEQISSIRRYEATLRSGSVIPVGRRLWADLQDRLLDYLVP